jgi:hypothetical protein
MENTTGSIVLTGNSSIAMNWGAIIGGWVVATGISTLLFVAGLAAGFTGFEPYASMATAKSVATNTAIWMIVTWIVALFLGGMFASWFDGRSDQTIGTLHGVTVWGLSVTASVLLFAFGAGHLLHGGAVSGMRTADHAPMTSPQDDSMMALQSQLAMRMSRGAAGAAPATSAPAAAGTAGNPGQSDRQGVNAATRALVRGDNDGARAILAANGSMSSQDIDQTIQAMSPQVEKYKTDTQAAAQNAAHYMAMAMGVIFLGIFLALIASAAGGWMGAGHVHKVHHLRRYDTISTTEPHPLIKSGAVVDRNL